ncbi:MAG: 5-formyltetrahydrofolate cyclo-ligase [Alphaproteobacteria bacterium]|jgi:5-formyltetrahydrofolate cyclo-ligase|nr:5-formyltetrahydrofolate cyclo-ligase [Alphaproteobacteria bacterium]
MSDVRERKQALRKDATACRAAAAATADGTAAERLADNFQESVPVPDGAVVSGFHPFGEEIDVMVLLRHLGAAGHELALPVVAAQGEPLVFRRWRKGDAMDEGPFGIREPRAEAPVLTPEVVLVPLLAFDRRGYRLGYGGGFYDRTLAGLRAEGKVLAAGVAYAAQEVDNVPCDETDEPLDWVVTEQDAIRIGGD